MAGLIDHKAPPGLNTFGILLIFKPGGLLYPHSPAIHGRVPVCASRAGTSLVCAELGPMLTPAKRRYFSYAKLAYAVPAALCLALTSLPAHADTPDHKAALFASGDGNLVYLAAGVGLPLLSDGRYGTRHALRVADALGTSVLLSEAIKLAVKEKRPDSNAHDSFPSGHATAAFAVATMESDLHPHQAAFWYIGATLISYSRVRLHRHTVGDVVAGAALGAGTARVEVAQPRGLILAPFIMRGGLGMMMSKGL